MKTLTQVLAAALVAVVATAGRTAAAEVPVLDLDRGSLRAFLGWKTPVLLSQDGKLVPLREPRRRGVAEEDRKAVPVVQADGPAPDWAGCEFDDSRWPRVRGPVTIHRWFGANIFTPGNPAELGVICIRGKFRVTDPQQVGPLKLTASYYGGIAIYVNGTELRRSHLRTGKIGPDTFAEPYPDEAYLRPDGRQYGEGDDEPFADRIACRLRSLPPLEADDAVSIPNSMLRKGVNVIAIEARAAAVRELTVTAAEGPTTWRGTPTPWPHVGLLSLRVTAPSNAGLVPNAGPSPAIELWSCQSLETVSVRDFADPSDQIAPMRIVGARNGTFSGKVVLSSGETIRNLKVTSSELAQEQSGGRIPASAVAVRRGEPAAPDHSWNRPGRFDRLPADFPAEIVPVTVKSRDEQTETPPVAVVPVWVTVRVPADVAPGLYRGTLGIEAEGAEKVAFRVPIHLEVHGWTLPDPDDFVTHHDIYQSPETVARYYSVPLWSERHFELMGKSLEVLHQVGNKVCVLNLTINSPNMGNSESMVRWIKQPDGSYRHDFSLVDRYLDLYAEKAGKPGIVCLNVWGHFREEDKQHRPPLSVSVLDPATGKMEPLGQPPYGTPENEAFWKPVLNELRARLEKRGWFDVTAVCYASYCWSPPEEMVQVYQNIWQDGRWMNSSHSNPSTFGGMPCPYSEWIWGCGQLYDPEAGAKPGSVQHTQFPRAWLSGAERIEMGNPRVGVGFISVFRDYSPLAAYRTLTEAAMQGGLRGVGRVGGDFWPLPDGDNRDYVPLCDSQFAIGPVNNAMAIVSPGPDGAAFNVRLEMFREGVQVAEAIVFLQRALETGSLDADLAARIERLLDERARYYLRTRPGQPASWWTLESSDWQGRDDRLFALAADAQHAAVIRDHRTSLPKRDAKQVPDWKRR